MGSVTELDCLCHHVHATYYNGGAEVQGGAQYGELFRDLERKFSAVVDEHGAGLCVNRDYIPRRREDKGKDAVWIDSKLLQDGQREGDGLTGPGLRVTYAVSAL